MSRKHVGSPLDRLPAVSSQPARCAATAGRFVVPSKPKPPIAGRRGMVGVKGGWPADPALRYASSTVTVVPAERAPVLRVSTEISGLPRELAW
jgi:hypothetical protein